MTRRVTQEVGNGPAKERNIKRTFGIANNFHLQSGFRKYGFVIVHDLSDNPSET